MRTESRHVVFLHQQFPCSGAEQVTIDVANYLCRQGYRVTVLAVTHLETGYHAGQERLFGIYLLPKGRTKWSPKVACAIRRFIVQEKVEVLVTYRELLYASWLKRNTSIKIVFELHNTPGYEYLGNDSSGWLLKWFYKCKYHRVYRWADAYGVLDNGYRQILVNELSLNTTKNKLWVLPNSIASSSKVAMPKDKLVIYVGRLTQRDKRVDRLLRIWQKAQHQLPEWQLKIVGKGKAAPRLKTLAEELQLERCSFEGHSAYIQNYYDHATILCLTSSFEGWPMVIAEAQANGVIPIVFNSFAAAKGLITTANEGILVPPFDNKLFAQQLVSLAKDEVRLQSMQKTVVQKAATYTIERSGAAWEEMLHHIIDTRV